MSKTFRTLALIELFGAALLILLGFMLIWWPGLTLRSLVMFCGAFLLVESISAMIGAWRCYGVLRWLRGGVGALGVALALLIVLLPDLTLSFIAAAVGLWTIMCGLGLMTEKTARRRWLYVLAGVLLVLAGIWFIFNHAAAIITIGLWAGMSLLVLGMSQVAAAIAVWRAAKNS